MPLREFLLPEFDTEMPYTRNHLEHVPMDRLDFKPHEKSVPLGWLATFLAVLPTWGTIIVGGTRLVRRGPCWGAPPERKVDRSLQELLQMFDKNVADARAALSAASDEQLQRPWSLAGRLIVLASVTHRRHP